MKASNENIVSSNRSAILSPEARFCLMKTFLSLLMALALAPLVSADNPEKSPI